MSVSPHLILLMYIYTIFYLMQIHCYIWNYTFLNKTTPQHVIILMQWDTLSIIRALVNTSSDYALLFLFTCLSCNLLKFYKPSVVVHDTRHV